MMNRQKFVSASGFTLVEIAIVILILGLALAGVSAFVQPILQQSRLKATEANMNRIIDVVSVYAQRNLRIPCPADPDPAATEPFGAEVGSGASGANIGSCDSPGDMVEGIVPYRTLGLTVDDIYDGWGNFITYAVSPVFADDTADPALQVQARCRIDGPWVTGGTNRNPMKARFCCPSAAVAVGTDIRILDAAAGTDIWPLARTNTGFANADIAFASGTTFDIIADNVTAPAFVLVSHGSNGYGAYLQGGARVPGAAAVTGDGEDENQDNDNVYVSTRMNLSGDDNDNFDDVVMWRTQDQLFAETGAGTCVVP